MELAVWGHLDATNDDRLNEESGEPGTLPRLSLLLLLTPHFTISKA